jgi:hypothetical protein
MAADTARIPRFEFNNQNLIKNPRVSDVDRFTSTVLTRFPLLSNGDGYPRYPKIDMIDEPGAEFFTDDMVRMA